MCCYSNMMCLSACGIEYCLNCTVEKSCTQCREGTLLTGGNTKTCEGNSLTQINQSSMVIMDNLITQSSSTLLKLPYILHMSANYYYVSYYVYIECTTYEDFHHNYYVCAKVLMWYHFMIVIVMCKILYNYYLTCNVIFKL